MSLIDFAAISIPIDLGNLKGYVNSQEDALKQALEKSEHNLKERSKLLSDSEKEELYEWHADDHWQLSKQFPAMSRGGSLLIVYGWYENELNSICEFARRDGNFTFGVKDLASQNGYSARAKTYLEKTLAIAFPTNEPYWPRLLRYQGVRNAVAHNDGFVADERLREWIGQAANITLDDHDRIQIEHGFIPSILDDLGQLFSDIVPKIQRSWPKTRVT